MSWCTADYTIVENSGISYLPSTSPPQLQLIMDLRPSKRPRHSRSPTPSAIQSHSKETISTSKTLPSRSIPSRRTRQQPKTAPSKTTTSPSKSLHTFFQPASEGQRWSSKKFQTSAETAGISASTGTGTGTGSNPGLKQKQKQKAELELDADEIDDDYDSYDEIFSQIQPIQQKQQHDQPQNGKSTPKTTSKPTRSKPKRFLLSDNSGSSTPTPTPTSTNASTNTNTAIDTRPWAQRFAPIDLTELAVHKRKVSDVQRWLDDVFQGRRREVCTAPRSSSSSR